MIVELPCSCTPELRCAEHQGKTWDDAKADLRAKIKEAQKLERMAKELAAIQAELIDINRVIDSYA